MPAKRFVQKRAEKKAENQSVIEVTRHSHKAPTNETTDCFPPDYTDTVNEGASYVRNPSFIAYRIPDWLTPSTTGAIVQKPSR
jgi:hypothetical protein